MANINLVTGSRGTDHITSADDGSLIAAIYGRGQYVLYGFEYRFVNSNVFRLSEGDALINGRHARINHNEVADIQLDTGTQGMKRIDLIVITYNGSGQEMATVDVIRGTPKASYPAKPSYTSGNILDGDTTVQVPLYSIEFDGINVASVKQEFEKARSLMDYIKEMIYPPVGYKVSNNTGENPSVRWPGTTWVLDGVGRVAVCIDTDDASFNTSKKTGGAKTVTLATGNLPAHVHSVPAHKHLVGGHYHIILSQEFTTKSAGRHAHTGYYMSDAAKGTEKNRYQPATSSTTASTSDLTAAVPAHTHECVLPKHYTESPAATEKTGNSDPFNTTSVGSATAINNLQPYIVEYRWVRTK